MRRILGFLIPLLILSFFSNETLFAQVGILKGNVYESEGLPSIGASVFVKGDNPIGTVTDIDGTFEIKDVPVGTQTVVFSFIGFQSHEKVILIEDGQSTFVEISLEAIAYEGREVLVTAQALGQAQAINQQINAESIANVVSAARIQELPDVNAAEAISRLPGIAINRSGGEGQKVVIRGMAPKFAAITVNGIRLPSNSGSDRSVDLSLISPELLDGIEVFKSPLPDMDAESVGGTVNLRLRKAPKKFKLLAKQLGGYNVLNKDFKDYKSVLQVSKRFWDDQLGVIFQASMERFNRSGDFLTNKWRSGPTDSTGVTAIFGDALRLEDRTENRKRQNASLALDYSIGKNNFSFFGLYSGTSRNRSILQESYQPSEPAITFIGTNIENTIKLTSLALQGEHQIGKTTVDWTIATSQSNGETPYSFAMRFEDNSNVFSNSLDANGHPRTYYESATPKFKDTYLRSARSSTSSTDEKINTVALNYKIPFSINSRFKGYLKFGGKMALTSRERIKKRTAEDFYYLGGQIGRDAISASSNPLILLPSNDELISILSFTNTDDKLDFYNEANQNIGLKLSLKEDLMRQWHDDQKNLLSNDRTAIVDNYEVNESVSAVYAMIKLKFGKKTSIIPGVRYESSDNTYQSGISTLSGRYGVNGTFVKKETSQKYGELLPHLHLKYQALSWLDLRASYATTLARPDFTYVTPRSQIDNNSLVIRAGNPELKHAKAQNYDFFVTAYKGNYGLVSAGLFFKEVENIFFPWLTNLYDQETADAFGFSNYKGYELRSYVNAGKTTIKGFEFEWQTNLRFLDGPFSGLVFNINYARLFSETESFFLTSETKLIIIIPPIFETTYTNHIRKVPMPSQPPHVLNTSIGYDIKKFSARISGTYQGTRTSGYSSNKDFDRFTQNFWRWDASVKQRFGKNWSIFLNINNFTNQQDISFTREEQYINTIETYGPTGTIGLQYQIK